MARETDFRHPAWKSITKYFRTMDYEDTAKEWVKEQEYFIELDQKHSIPADLIEAGCKRKTKRTQSKDHYPPLRLALEHVFREMYPNEKTPKYSTLRARYALGKAALKKHQA